MTSELYTGTKPAPRHFRGQHGVDGGVPKLVRLYDKRLCSRESVVYVHLAFLRMAVGSTVCVISMLGLSLYERT